MARKGLVLGLDIGIASCGSALIDLANNKIEYLGVRCFEKAENPKNGASLALPRRQARIARRRIRRRVRRLFKLRELFFKHGLVAADYVALVQSTPDPWALRVVGLDRLLSAAEFAVALLHIAKRRGFKSSKREVDDDKSDEGRLLVGTKELESRFRESGLRTIGEFLLSLDKKRNGREEYSHTVLRALSREEVTILFEKQRALENPLATQYIQDEFIRIAFHQRQMKSTLKLVGYCEFEAEQYRAARKSYYSERARLFQEINHLRLNIGFRDDKPLGDEQRKEIEKLAYQKSEVKYSDIRKALELEERIYFSKLRYPSQRSTKKDDPEKATFIKLEGYHKIRLALKDIDPNHWRRLSSDPEMFDKIGWILTVFKDDEEIENNLLELGLIPEIIARLLRVRFSGHGSLSTKAIKKLLPFLEDGQIYSDAVMSAGLKKAASWESKGAKLPPVPPTGNPVVDRALAQSRKVINAVIREYGVPEEIRVELAREVGKSFTARREIESQNKEREADKTKAKEEFTELFKKEPVGPDLEKYRLWKEQQCFCVYALEEISPQELVDGTATQIDHILPWSRSWDNSWSNKVLVKIKANQDKRNQTPFEWFGNDEIRWGKFEVRINCLPFPKRRRLLMKDFSEKVENEWKSRNLNDTRFITRVIMNHIREHIDFGDETGRHVFSTNGAITNYLRRRWGLGEKLRDQNDLHHAVDAAAIACTTESILQRITRYQKQKEINRYAPGQEPHIPDPWDDFRRTVKEAAKEIFVSRAPERRGTGEIHQDTIRSERTIEGQKVVVQRVPLLGLKLAMLEDLFQKERNIKLYSTIKQRFDEVSSDPKKAFKEPVHMPGKKGERGPEIKAVTISTGEKSGVYVRGGSETRRGFASNGGQVRCDVYSRDGKYFLVPVYTANIASGIPARKIIFYGVDESARPEVDQTYRFVFSLYPNDLVHVQSGGKNSKEFWGYYRGVHRATGQINLMCQDGSNEEQIGSRTLSLFEKYQVDVLGRRYVVTQEKPRNDGLANRRRKQAVATKLPTPSNDGEMRRIGGDDDTDRGLGNSSN